ncbi:MAG TPA: hypothetical protein VK519_14260 [Pinirhizobacter sp.]|uniref:hypothetical protein n=1 Tax=Pinirhizobacter sp. TaxID=2950432 RepID=UPI002CDA9624|nr:hypothetical protein [Pinirhizobacter sp.]HMH69073.1 hypothetical protein [Pinirhizobacter sp.]
MKRGAWPHHTQATDIHCPHIAIFAPPRGPMGAVNYACHPYMSPAMEPRPDRNAELERNFEPLRVGLAIGALLLGLLMSLH